MVRHYALNYGFHTFPNLLENLLERHVALFNIYVCSTDLGTYGSHTKGHSVGPLVHCLIDSNYYWLWI